MGAGSGGGPTSHTVLVVGSINWDITVRVHRFPTPGETLLGHSVVEGLGGKGANQAVAAARAGAQVQLLATVGDDAHGRALRAALHEFGVGTDLLAVSPTLPTGTAHITVDAAGQNHIIVVPGANVGTTPHRLGKAAGAVRDAGAVVCQGEVPPETVAAVLELAGRRTSASVVLNLAPVVALPAGAIESARVLVVNETEASLLLGSTVPNDVPAALALARDLTQRSRAVVVTVGSRGAVLAERDGTELVVPAPRPSRVVDTTGAGDALVGVLAATLARGAALPAAVANGVTAATASVERPGASASYPVFDLPGTSA